MPISAPEAVIFDLDGCLVDSEPLALKAIAIEMRACGVENASADYIRERFLGVSIKLICDHVSERTGVACPEDFVDRVETRLLADYRVRLRCIDGAFRLLDRLGAAGVGIAIATGGSLRRMQATLEITGLAARFAGFAFSADQVARGKPAPDLFLLAADKLGIEPGRCLVVEDSRHGLIGAKAAGMRAFGFVGGTHLDGIREAHAEILRDAGASSVFMDLDALGDRILQDRRPSAGQA